jgi:hypothetical protein
VRVAFGGTEIRNLLIQHWGIPLMIDNANGVKLRRVDCVPQQSSFTSTPMSVPCVVDTCFEVWFNDCNFLLNSDLSATQFAPAAVWLTVGQITGFTGLVNFRRCTCNGSGFYINSLLPLTPLSLFLELFSFDDIITESLRHPAIVLDSRQ